MRTKRGITIIRHLMPCPTEWERALALRQLSGDASGQARWPTWTLDGEGHYLVLPPEVLAAAPHGTSDFIQWQMSGNAYYGNGTLVGAVAGPGMANLKRLGSSVPKP